MIFCLLIASLLPATIVVVRARQLTHVVLFSAGYLYYWVLPVLVGQIRLFDVGGGDGLGRWAALFQGVPDARLAVYTASILVYYLFFLLGDSLAKKTAPPTRQIVQRPSLTFIFLLYGFVFAVASFYIYHLRSLVGANYNDIGEGILSMGTLVAISLVLLALALLKTAENEKGTFLATISNKWIIGYFVIAFLQLTMGGRLYFVSFLLLLAAYRSVFFKKYSARQLLIFFLGADVLSGAAGLLRLRSGFNAGAVVLNLAAEPVFTSFSLVSFLSYNHIPWLEFPRFLAGDFLNLVPSAILSNKMDLFPDPIQAGFFFVSPLGAMSSWVSFIINFGLAGTAIVMAFMGFGLRRLLMKAANSPISKTQYLICSAFLTFSFFRDPFSVSLVKNFFEFGLVMPFVCAHLSGWLVWSAGAQGAPIEQENHRTLDAPETMA